MVLSLFGNGCIDCLDVRNVVKVMTYSKQFLEEVAIVAQNISPESIEEVVDICLGIKSSGGRLFFAGSGGGAGHASHATCDFRKLVGVESYCVSDNVSELTARINDESWEDSYVSWLKASRLNANDGVFIFSVGGGDAIRRVSMQLVNVMDYAKSVGAKVVGVAGRDGGYLAKVADGCVIIPPLFGDAITSHTEGFQAVVWHLMIGHPRIVQSKPVWETLAVK